MIIEKKAWKDLFQAIVEGRKTFDVRLGNFQCREGDVLWLREWDEERNIYTGREIKREITFVGRTKEWKFWSDEEVAKYGYVVMGLGEEKSSS